MQRVIKNIFLKDNRLENNLKFWALLGPYLLFLSITLATFDLAIFTALALFLCYRFRSAGLIFALIALFGFSFYQQVNLEDRHLWNLGLQFSIALGLIISTFGFEEIKNYLSLHEENKTQDINSLQQVCKEKESRLEALRKNLEENLIILKGELSKKTQKLVQINQENDTLKKDLQDSIQRKDYLFNELDNKIKEIDELHIKQDELYEKISFLKDEEFLHEKNKNLQQEIQELTNLSETFKKEKEKFISELQDKNKKIEELVKNVQTNNFEDFDRKIKENEILNLKEKLKTKVNISTENITDTELLNEYKDKLKKFNHINSLYLQLKHQFEDKQNVLHKTRQELFHVKEKLTAYQKQSEDFEDIDDFEKTILSDLDQTIEDLQKCDDENSALEEVVSYLVNKQKN